MVVENWEQIHRSLFFQQDFGFKIKFIVGFQFYQPRIGVSYPTNKYWNQKGLPDREGVRPDMGDLGGAALGGYDSDTDHEQNREASI